MTSLAVYPKRKHKFTGSYPQLSCNKDGWVVMVFNGAGLNGSNMYSIAGMIEGDNIKWEEKQNMPQFISKGHYPKVAINDSKVIVEVHKSQWWHTIWYRVGILEGSTKAICWCDEDHPLGNTGCNPAIALSNEGIVVVAFEEDNKTFYCVGQVSTDTKEIAWLNAGVKYEFFNILAKEPSISMNENGLVVAAARACYDNCKIIFRVGTLENSNTIKWKEVDQTVSRNMSGWGPVVAINKQNCIISMHMSYQWRKVLMKCGTITDSKKIVWSEQFKPLDCGFGMYPSVTINSEGQVVRMNEINFGGYSMYYEVGNLS